MTCFYSKTKIPILRIKLSSFELINKIDLHIKKLEMLSKQQEYTKEIKTIQKSTKVIKTEYKTKIPILKSKLTKLIKPIQQKIQPTKTPNYYKILILFYKLKQVKKQKLVQESPKLTECINTFKQLSHANFTLPSINSHKLNVCLGLAYSVIIGKQVSRIIKNYQR